MKIYTKTGDKGYTGLFGGERVPKNHIRLETYGTVDELNSLLGVALTEIKSEEIKKILLRIQHELFNVGAELATPENKKEKRTSSEIDDEFISRLENEIDLFFEKTPPMKLFILPGGTKGAAYLHYARTVCRRAERLVITLTEQIEINEQIVVYLNRLSDLLFVLARCENFVNNTPDVMWQKNRG